MAKDIQVCVGVGVDVDAVAGWLGSYGGADSPNDIQRGVFARGGGLAAAAAPVRAVYAAHDLVHPGALH
jgi:hypothetical protein